MVLQILLDLSAGQVAALLPFAVLTAVAFVVINYALVAWLGGVGRFISVALAVAAAAASITCRTGHLRQHPAAATADAGVGRLPSHRQRR